MKSSTMAVLGAVCFALVSIISGVITPKIENSLMFDDRLAMDIRNIKISTPSLKSGARFAYEFDYDKRIECYPPLGGGEVVYRIWIDGPDGFQRFRTVEPGNISYADPQLHHRTTEVDLPSLTPGKYKLQYRVTFTCKGASRIQQWDGPLMPFEVIK